MNNVQQMKLNNGEEIVCEVVGWADDESNDLGIRYVLKIAESFDPSSEITTYVLRPWVLYKQNIESIIYLNAINVIAATEPCEDLKRQYIDAVKELSPLGDEKEKELVPRSNEGNVIRFPKG